MKTWYQVYLPIVKTIFPIGTENAETIMEYTTSVFGFCIQDGIIVSHPNFEWKNVEVKHYKPFLLRNNATVVKIADIL